MALMVQLSVLLVLLSVYVFSPLDCPGLARPTGLMPFSPDFAGLLGMLTPLIAPAAQLVVTAVSFPAAQQPAVPMATAVGRGVLLELLYPTELGPPRTVEMLVAQQEWRWAMQVGQVVG